jgi:indolepyruvate ferredoxin oxidoreductase alpha subunit
MAERSFAREVEDLKLGEGEIFRGEGILAITKALLRIRRFLCRRLPGLTDLAPDGRAGRCQGHHGADLGVHFETSGF